MNNEEWRFYDEMGASYFWLAGKRHLALAALEAHGALAAFRSNPQRILDIGCGPGHDFHDFKGLGRIYGTDVSWTTLESYRKNVGLDAPAVCASANQLPFLSGVFDGLILLDVLEHLEDELSALRDCHRILKPGGWFLLSVPAFQWLWGPHDELYGHKRRYTVSELRQKIEGAGFSVNFITYIQWIFTFPMFVLRRLKRCLPQRYRKRDFVKIPGWMNRVLTRVITLESYWLKRRPLPWGPTILCIASIQRRR